MEIADGALDRRMTAGSLGDELDRLAQAFNTMLDRIQALMLGMREMTDNLAHDLRSPVARIRASAEMALAGGGSMTEWEALASDTTEECERLRVKMSVTDTGLSMTAEELPRIFQRFYRSDWSRSEYGNGLGLSLALAFVRAHGGDIAVRSSPGEGSTFTVVLSRSRESDTSHP